MAYTVKRALFTAEQKSCIQTILTKVLVSTAELIFGRIDVSKFFYLERGGSLPPSLLFKSTKVSTFKEI